MRLRRSSSLAVVTALLGLSAAAGVAAAPAAVAAPAPQYKVTFVARVCSTYSEIMANRARNNIQESLRDLGKDTVYTSGQPVSPAIEAPNNPACTPLDDWQFRLGTGIKGKTPATDYLSTVTGDYGQTITVAPTTPELDAQGQTTGRTLQDAVTVTLTDAQAQRAQQGSSLWTQGGTTTDPLLNGIFPGQFGFGALRCAVDNLNGDNVEWIGFPSGSKHVFCYYYAVKPPPSAGTIVVKKALATGSSGPAQFRYVGNISYTTTNDFTLTPQSDTAPDSATFIRAAGDSWDFEEQTASGFALVSLTCEQTTPPVDGPDSSWTVTGRKAVVKVGDGATVVCTYVNRDVPPPTGRLRLSKVTFGGTGTFPFKITDPSGTATKYSATTKTEGVQVVVAETPSTTPGTWKARETLPAATSLGRWTATSVQCNGDDVAFTTAPGTGGTTLVSASQNVASRETMDCVFANTFTPGGEIVLGKRTSGGVGTFGFPVVRLDQFAEGEVPTDLFTSYQATTTAEGVVADGDPTAGQRSLTHLPVGEGAASTYVIGELSPPDTADASWSLTTVTCTDVTTDTVVPTVRIGSLAAVQVELTAAHPRLRCVFDNELVATGGVATDSAVLVTKKITGNDAGKQGAVVLTLSCVDGTTGIFTVAARTTGTRGTEAPFIVPDGTSCTLTETSTGANAAAELTSTTMRVGSAAEVSATSVTFTTSSAAPLTVAVVDVYGGLAPSGAGTGTGLTALAGLLLLGTGLALVLAARRQIG